MLRELQKINRGERADEAGAVNYDVHILRAKDVRGKLATRCTRLSNQEAILDLTGLRSEMWISGNAMPPDYDRFSVARNFCSLLSGKVMIVILL